MSSTEQEKRPRFANENEQSSRKLERTRVLTMKYGRHQMALIRKRMSVESWIDDRIAELFAGKENNGVDVDLDSLMDADSGAAKKKIVFDQLQSRHCPASMDKISAFLDELVEQLMTL